MNLVSQIYHNSIRVIVYGALWDLEIKMFREMRVKDNGTVKPRGLAIYGRGEGDDDAWGSQRCCWTAGQFPGSVPDRWRCQLPKRPLGSAAGQLVGAGSPTKAVNRDNTWGGAGDGPTCPVAAPPTNSWLVQEWQLAARTEAADQRGEPRACATAFQGPHQMLASWIGGGAEGKHCL